MVHAICRRRTMQRFIVANALMRRYGAQSGAHGDRGFAFLLPIKFPLANFISISLRWKFPCDSELMDRFYSFPNCKPVEVPHSRFLWTELDCGSHNLIFGMWKQEETAVRYTVGTRYVLVTSKMIIWWRNFGRAFWILTNSCYLFGFVIRLNGSERCFGLCTRLSICLYV